MLQADCGSLVQPGVVGPLIPYSQRSLHSRLIDHAVLGEYCQAEPGDQFRNPVVDFGVDVVGPPGEYDAAAPVGSQPLQGAAAFGANIGLDLRVLGVAGRDCFASLGDGDPELGEGLDQTPGQMVGLVEVEERHQVADVRLPQAVHVRTEHLRIERDHRTVEVVVGLGRRILLVGHTGVEDGAHAALQQVLDMPVAQLGGVADVFRRDRLCALGQGLVVRALGQHDSEAQRRQHREPERIVLVHVQHPRDADIAAPRLGLSQPPVAENAAVFVVVQVRHAGFG